ncbi:hypothetical protein MBM_06154 [Drepanopeziza brunnea f. sp. 'multigermtubi' MB_m1]|uniref:DDE-1 domain-containing protein n=1 Tax=Marssonina brunnea f. sp. multigermtubi (strain MB_m1) TaxID=1072389 RepID=K1WR70_MARBU|nr:uncharacterized protein MBM_06154 [Drepanopeziza brunnea f. sp. 'multigermtubi' MB_m1]EKD15526.1 hypothetical protein MBM_06154 [Drepanopeziza brunnea f. sp. 'multigermtubi' MB_m1]
MIEKPDTLKRRWNRYQAKQARLKEGKALQVGRLMVLSAAQHKAVLIYAANQATKGGKGAIKHEKGARICMPAEKEVIVPIGIKEMYTGICENRLSVTVIEAILADRKAIPLMIIVLGKQIIASWFSEKMTRHEVVTVSESGYTNDRITIEWLKHFIKHTDQGPDKPIALSSLSRQRFDIAKQSTETWLLRGSLDQAELDKNQKLQRDTHRKKLIGRSSLQTGGNILASKALEKVKAIKIKKQEASFKIANAKLKSATIKIRNDRYNQGVLDRKAEKERKKWLNEAYKQQGRGIPIHIPPEREVLIRDREKQPTVEELEADNIDLISFRDAVANEEAALKEV